ncbi:helix-turn-helix domain-containing protein [Bradyrhizobium sp. Pa8]|uniref:helix-turn-helix domain-containing protein n=1 Tax=Bradyrhizobium sp. Pa8 TaxID=3386552 RepID=UPI00403F7AAC
MSQTFNEELGRRIRAAREGKLTQAKLGELVGLSRTAITNIECGRQRLLVDQLVQIADAIGISTSALLPPDGDERRQQGDARITAMPTVQQWITSVKKSAARDRT